MNLKALKETLPWNWPEGTRELLLGVLKEDHAGEPDLLVAAELAGDLTVVDDELAEALLSIVESDAQPEKLRAQAALSLGPVLEQSDIEGFEDTEGVAIAESTFHKIQNSLRRLGSDAKIPGEVRRRILEASVRAAEDWHRNAIRAAWSSTDPAWRLTAVFCMQFLRGFDKEILEALRSHDPNLKYEAVVAAGTWELNAAWPEVVALATSPTTDKHLVIAAIEAVSTIHPHEAANVFIDLAESDDEDIVAAVQEAIAMAERSCGENDELDDDEDPAS
jgi:HEAT repeat protein